MHESLANHTSWRVGGPADVFYLPFDLDDLVLFLKNLDESDSVFWMGLGSNLLIRDGGIAATVICTRGRLREIRWLEPELLYIEAGVPCAHVARISAEKGLTGAEFLAGIPGTMGGALAMNAGAFGGETWDLVEQIITVNKQGMVFTRSKKEYSVGYRSVAGPDGEWFLGCEIRLEQGDSQISREKIKGLLARRNETQPTNLPSCGSVFRNPPGDHAARLIEASGLKGYCIGGACVSTKHANFIVNKGTASASDIEKLIEYVHSEVMSRQGIELIREVKIAGRTALESA